jgi:hypothetical protein
MKKKNGLHLRKIKIANINTIAFKIKGGDTANCTSDTVLTLTYVENCLPTLDYFGTCTESAVGSCTQNTREETNQGCDLNPTSPGDL